MIWKENIFFPKNVHSCRPSLFNIMFVLYKSPEMHAKMPWVNFTKMLFLTYFDNLMVLDMEGFLDPFRLLHYLMIMQET